MLSTPPIRFIVVISLLVSLLHVGHSSGQQHGQHFGGVRRRPAPATSSASTWPEGSPRPCFICPANAVISLTQRPSSITDGDQPHCPTHPGQCVPMPEPIVRPCLNSKKHEGQHGLRHQPVKTQVVRGPQPGSLLGVGTYRVVIRVFYGPPLQPENKDDTNDTEQREQPRRRRRRVSYCRYSVTIVQAANINVTSHPVGAEDSSCQPPAAPDHGRVTCSSSINNEGTVLTHCRYVCDDGYVAPKSLRHLIRQEWPCGRINGSSSPTPLQCIKVEAPIPLDDGQCSDKNVTAEEGGQIVQLALPRFRQLTEASSSGAIEVNCDVDSVKSLGDGTTGGSHPTRPIRRSCLAVNTETGAQFNCTYNVFLVDQTKNKSTGLALMLAQLHFQIGPFSATAAESHHRSSWCDDPVVAERLIKVVRDGLIRRINAESCRKANCTQLSFHCNRNGSTDSNLSAGGVEDVGAVLDVEWTVTADYASFSAEDYFYEGGEVPEGEAVIEKIQAETESAVELDDDLRKEIELAGGKLVDGSFRLGHLDLICPKSGYVLDPTTNQCQKCPAKTYQVKGTCEPCPEGTVQPLPGQTECVRPSSNRRFPPAFTRRQPVRGSSSGGQPIMMHRKESVFMIQPMIGEHAGRHPGVIRADYKKKRISSQPHPAAATARLVEHRVISSNQIPDEDAKVDEDDPCRSNPCRAGGTCVRHAARRSFRCSCPPGYIGTRCDTKLTTNSSRIASAGWLNCPARYCLNGGTCFVDNSYQGAGSPDCNCPPGFSGARCQDRQSSRPVLRNLPATNPAKNLVRRLDVPGGHHRGSEVVKHPTGNKKVSTKIAKLSSSDADGGLNNKNEDEKMMGFCVSSPCKNNGRCVDHSHAVPSPGFFTCVCPPHYQGMLCEFALCPAGMDWRTCPGRFGRHHQHLQRQHHRQCVIETSTGRRHCRPFNNNPLSN